jgi:transposase-like protein
VRRPTRSFRHSSIAPSRTTGPIWIDATYVKVRQNGRIVSVTVKFAVGVNSGGGREVLGRDIGASETETLGTIFQHKLARRGLRGVKLVVPAMKASRLLSRMCSARHGSAAASTSCAMSWPMPASGGAG